MSHVSQINMITETEVLPEWLAEVTDDLDVYMAQRDFEEAVSLIEKNRAYWESASPYVVNIHRDLKYDSLRFKFKYLLSNFQSFKLKGLYFKTKQIICQMKQKYKQSKNISAYSASDSFYSN